MLQLCFIPSCLGLKHLNPDWQKFTNSGTFSVTHSTSTSNFSLTVKVTYPTVLKGNPTQVNCVGITSFTYLMKTNMYFYIATPNNGTSSAFWVNIASNSGVNISNFILGWLIVDPTFTSPFSIGFIDNPYNTVLFASPWNAPFTNLVTQVNFTLSTGVIMNMSHALGAIAFITIFDAASSTYCFSLQMDYFVLNQSYYQVTASSYCKMTLYEYGLSRILFDQTQIQDLGYSYFTFGTLIGKNSDYSPFTFDSLPFFPSNCMVGLQTFNITGQGSLNFTTTIGPTTTIVGSTQFIYMSFNYFTFKYRSCPSGIPYFLDSEQLCYDVCPDGYYANISTNLCLPCSYTCLTCQIVRTNCTNCDPQTNRYQNGSTCPPNPGYFDNGVPATVPCSSVLVACLTCTNATTCTSCNTTGYYKNGTVCKSCMKDCVTCSLVGSTVTCSECVQYYDMGQGNTSCIQPICTDSYCAFCPTGADNCQVCKYGYHLFNITTVINSTNDSDISEDSISIYFYCQSICGDNMTVDTQECDDGNNIDGDGCNSDCTFGNNNNCSSIIPLRDPNTNKCTNTCPNPYFHNTTAYNCDPCNYTCSSCQSLAGCTSCSSQNNRFLNGTQCSPSNGYFENQTTEATLCVSPCNYCISETLCTTCVSGYFISKNDCIICQKGVQYCLVCDNSTYCTKCAKYFTPNETTGLCDLNPCDDTGCRFCTAPNGDCIQCFPGYYKNTEGICLPNCGDFIKVVEEQCDDGNVNPYDGCSPTCTIEQDFRCELNNATNPGSDCYYIGEVTINQLNVIKVQGKNEIQIVLDISPNNVPAVNNNLDNLIKIYLGNNTQAFNITTNPDGTITLTVDYTEDIQGKQMKIVVGYNNDTNSTIFSKMNDSQISVVINPSNNEAAHFYEDSVYKMAKLTSLLCTAIGAAALVVFCVSIICGKMVGVEMMAVFQITFFSLLTLSQMNPCFASLSSLWLVNGYNQLKHNNDFLNDPFTPTPPKGIMMYSMFTQNFNFTFAIILIPLLCALISFILSKTAMKNNQKVLKVVKNSIGEYTFMGLMFGGYLISVSLSLQISYGRKNMSDMMGIISISQSGLLALLIIGYFIFALLKPNFFGEFSEQFKSDKLSSKFYNIMLVERVVTGSVLILLLSIKMQGAIPIGIFLLLGTFIVVHKPYIKIYHNYRQIGNLVIAILIELILLSCNFIHPSSSTKIFYFLPLGVCVLLVLCIIFNGAAIAYGFYTKFFKKKVDTFEQQQFAELCKQRKFNIGVNDSDKRLLINKTIDTGDISANRVAYDKVRMQLKSCLLNKPQLSSSKSSTFLQTNMQPNPLWNAGNEI